MIVFFIMIALTITLKTYRKKETKSMIKAKNRNKILKTVTKKKIGVTHYTQRFTTIFDYKSVKDGIIQNKRNEEVMVMTDILVATYPCIF